MPRLSDPRVIQTFNQIDQTDERADIARERLDFQREKALDNAEYRASRAEAGDAFRQAEIQQKADFFERRSTLAEQKAEEQRLINANNAMVAQRKLDEKKAALIESNMFLSEARGLTGFEDDYMEKMEAVRAKYPMALFDDDSRRVIDNTFATANDIYKTRQANRLSEKEKGDLVKTGVSAGKSTFGRPDAPKDDSQYLANLEGDIKKYETLENPTAIEAAEFEGLKTKRETYMRLNQAKTSQPAQAQPANTVDPKILLANKALKDPNASEAHKEAARKILGL
jgi:hypothetical protein